MRVRAIVATLVVSSLCLALWACSSGSSAHGQPSSAQDAAENYPSAEAAVDAPSLGDVTSPTADAGEDAASPDAGTDGAEGSAADGGWVLTFSDEFNETDGSAPDPTKWNDYSISEATSGSGWGIEYDTPAADVIESGNLVITATQAADGGVFSGAIDTKGKFQQGYGRWEASIKVPEGAGTWPAFWLMGDTNGERWPTCGEIDIVEVVSPTPKDAYGSVHSGNVADAGTAMGTTGVYTFDGGDLSAGYHLFAIDWSPNVIAYSVDGNVYETDTPTSITSGEAWVFDHPFYIILNLAIGGSWPGPPNASTFPAKMYVDYVRVYRQG